MNIYIVISIILLFFFLIEQYTYSEKLNRYLFYLGAFLVIGLLAFRGDTVGGDTDDYCDYFTGNGGSYGIFETNDTFEIGFRWLCWILMKISRTEFWFIFSTSLITILPFIYLVNRDCKGSKILPLCLYMMTPWHVLSVTQTAIRQDISVAFVFITYILLTSNSSKKKWLRYLLSIISLGFAFISHTSSIVALPLLVISYFIPFTKKSSIIAVVGSFLIVMIARNIFSSIFDLFTQYMTGLEFAQHMIDTYYGNMDYALNQEVSFNRLGPATLLICLLIWMSEEGDFKNPYLRWLVVGGSLYNIGSTFPMIFRTVYLLLFLGIIFVPSHFKNKKNVIPKVILIMLIAFFIRTFAVYMKPHQADQMLPYTFIWENK